MNFINTLIYIFSKVTSLRAALKEYEQQFGEMCETIEEMGDMQKSQGEEVNALKKDVERLNYEKAELQDTLNKERKTNNVDVSFFMENLINALSISLITINKKLQFKIILTIYINRMKLVP